MRRLFAWDKYNAFVQHTSAREVKELCLQHQLSTVNHALESLEVVAMHLQTGPRKD